METTQAQGTWFDSFAQIASSYFNMRGAESQADASGAAQAQLNNTVEQQTGTGQVPLNGDQLSGLSGQIGGINANYLILGGVGLLATLLIIKK